MLSKAIPSRLWALRHKSGGNCVLLCSVSDYRDDANSPIPILNSCCQQRAKWCRDLQKPESLLDATLALMTLDELKIELAAVLSAEEASNWEGVEALSEHTYIRLTTEPETPQDYPHEEVIGYLAGFLRRQSDVPFAEQQHRWLQSYLRTRD